MAGKLKEKMLKALPYMISVVSGIIPALLAFNSLFSDAAGSLGVVLAQRFIVAALLYVIVGIILGLVWPKVGWKLGVWLCAPLGIILSFMLAIFIMSFIQQSDKLSLVRELLAVISFFGGLFVSACFGAYVSSRIRQAKNK
jgi:hypothetical protein